MPRQNFTNNVYVLCKACESLWPRPSSCPWPSLCACRDAMVQVNQIWDDLGWPGWWLMDADCWVFSMYFPYNLFIFWVEDYSITGGSEMRWNSYISQMLCNCCKKLLEPERCTPNYQVLGLRLCLAQSHFFFPRELRRWWLRTFTSCALSGMPW